MQATFGDIVEINAEDWIIATPHPSSSGSPWVRCMRPGEDGAWTALVTGLAGLQVKRRPNFEVGQRVRTGPGIGTITAIENDFAYVALEPDRRPLAGGGNLAFEGHTSTVPLWKLALENWRT